jgi:hypothetical protein
MPLNEEDLDHVFDLKCKLFLQEMKKEQFYSYDEIKDLILKSSIHGPQLNNAKGSENIIVDIAYVEAVIQAQFAVGNLRCGEKDGKRYYAKV